MERNRSTSLPKAAADSPRSRQQSRQIGRIKRAQANQAQAMKNENAGPNSKMSRKASVAKRAQQIYSGKINPKEKTKSRLTKTTNPEALRKRVAKIKDNTKATSKPAKRKAVGAISEAKAGRIIARMDANRPGLRPASGSNRKTANAIKTYKKASDFALAASSRARKQGKNLSVNESLQRGVKNANKAAAAKRKRKP